jgi:hypothetical protein
MRRRKLLVALALAVAVAAAAVVLLPRPDRIAREDYDRIRPGMTRGEVEAILGPPGDYRTGRGESDFGDNSASRWIGDPTGFHVGIAGWLAYWSFPPV